MRIHRFILGAAGAVMLTAGALGVACDSSGEGGREVVITQTDDGCTPARIEATTGEKLKLVVNNEASGDFEVEGIEGTKLEEVVVPEGRTRTPGFRVPDDAGTSKIKCYIPGGATTIIEVVASAEGASAAPTPTVDIFAATPVAQTVHMSEWKIEGMPERISHGGVIDFTAVNDGTVVHQLSVLKVLDGDRLDFNSQTAELAPGQSGVMSVLLDPGTYQLACLIAPGQAGSTENHLVNGMKARFVVE